MADVTPQTSIARGEVVQLDISVETASWEGLFDSLEIYRSRLSQGGPFEPLMGDTWAAARLPSGVEGDPPTVPEIGGSRNVVGLKLELLMQETTELSITFTGSNPLTLAQVATQIQNASGGLLRSFVKGGILVIETTKAGSGAVLRTTGGDAVPFLGLSAVEPDSLAFGLDARIPLVKGETSYVFSDPNGQQGYYYRARFFNSVDRTVSEFGPPFTGRFVTGISATNMVRGFVDFVDSNGAAKANQEVLVYVHPTGSIVEGKVVVPSAPTRLLSDTDGHVELQLVRGSKVTIAVAGTDLIRDIEVPTDPNVSAFCLLDPTYGKNDLFKVRIPALEYAARRSL